MVETSEPNERDESERSCAAESIEFGLACNRIDLVSASKDIAAHVLKKHFKASTILSPRDRARLLSRRLIALAPMWSLRHARGLATIPLFAGNKLAKQSTS